MLKSNEIREQFIEFFKNKNHKYLRSASVIPIDDPTLLFTNAGMNQFKDIFLGKVNPEFKRVMNSQKCIRAGGKHNDLEEVGKDGYHHTFFEMLGNWSFGDYYKEEAIIWAWELLTSVWRLPKEKLYATVYKDDQESYELWKNKTDINPTHIEFHGDKDNFWEMGKTGPCGPCSEIHIDRGIEFCNLKDDASHICKVNGDCHRYIELWNLVFMQYFRDEEGVLHPLAQKFVDTGAGFERLVQILQDKNSNYETDIFQPVIQEIAEYSKVKYFPDGRGVSHRVIADHIRALSFAIADGGMPSNEGRGYVLRRILRRAARHGRLLGFFKPFLYILVDCLVDLMGKIYPELSERQAHIKMIIKAEEERFNLTLDKGIEKFEEIIFDGILMLKDKQIFPGTFAFMLYDTFGFPLDLTIVMANEKGFEVDVQGFHKEMEKQRTRARNAAKFILNFDEIDWIGINPESDTKFVGYNNFSIECKIQKYAIDDKNNIKIILDKTPFYTESGGQTADIGKIYNDNCKIKIMNVQKAGNHFIHIGKLISGNINSEIFVAKIDKAYRKNIAGNHTVTHLLHKALKEVLGDHVQQKGSAVQAEILRFDFTNFKQVSRRELKLVENIVNAKIRECLPVKTELKDLESARKEGAVALFGEKYGEIVRVVSIADYSKEFCGGTHVNFTGEIGLFKILSESSIAAGIRRIEAVTGEFSEKIVNKMEDNLEEISGLLNTQTSSVLEKIHKLLDEQKLLQKTISQFKEKNLSSLIDSVITVALKFDDFKIVIAIHSR